MWSAGRDVASYDAVNDVRRGKGTIARLEPAATSTSDLVFASLRSGGQHHRRHPHWFNGIFSGCRRPLLMPTQ